MRRSMKTWFVIGILALALTAAGCGGEGNSDGNGGGQGGGPSVGPSVGPSGGPSSVDGAESPEALIEMARPWAETNDMGRLIGVIAPSDRPVMAFMGMFMAKMMPQMLEMAAAFNPDEAAQKDAKEKLKGMNDGVAAVLEKHGVDLSKIDGPEVQGLMSGGDPEPDQVRTLMQTHFPDLEPGPFLTDILAVISKFGDEDKTPNMASGFTGKLENLEVTGDRATGTVDGDPMVFVRENGRWYVSISESMREE